MTADEVKKVAVIGSGTMGSQIAMVFALAGYQVQLQDVAEASLEKARQSLQGHMDNRVRKGRLSQETVDQAFARMNFTTSLEEALQDVDLAVEAIIENLKAKQELFAQMDKLAPERTILTTNSSTIVSSKLAQVTQRADRVCNMHFFNPALVMELVEVVVNPHTSQETADTVMEVSRRIGKTPILIKKEISGFVVNRILGKLTDEALSLYEQGVASFEDIDLACTKGLNHPMGPFQLLDLSGLDISYAVRMQRYQETGDPKDKPYRVIEEKVKRGELGRKTGKGFYTYQ